MTYHFMRLYQLVVNCMKISLWIPVGLIPVSLCFIFFVGTLHALTVDEIIKLKQAGVEDRTIQLLIEKEKVKREGTSGLGVKETTRPDGGKDVTYFSVTTPEEERKAQQEEQEKMEKALEILRNIIINDRRR
jgi:hypothetical protein